MYKTIQHQTLVISACTKCANQENVTKTENTKRLKQMNPPTIEKKYVKQYEILYSKSSMHSMI